MFSGMGTQIIVTRLLTPGIHTNGTETERRPAIMTAGLRYVARDDHARKPSATLLLQLLIF